MNDNTLNNLLKAMKRHKNNIKCILEEQPMTLFNSEDFYKGEQHILETLILVIELLEKGKSADFYLNGYKGYEEEE